MPVKEQTKAKMSTHNDNSDPIHGNLYQLKLLMLILYRGIEQPFAFRMGTEVKEAKKFDDIIFEYTEGNKKVSRLLQAKHRKDEKTRIKASDLLTESGGDFSLIKYFFSYQDLKKEKLFRGKIKDVIIYTNINFDISNLENSSIFVVEISDGDHFLDFNYTPNPKQSVRYKFSKNFNKILQSKLEECHLAKLSAKLIDLILNNGTIKHQNKWDTFYNYDFALAEEVINVKDKNFQDKFIANENISPAAEKFRNIFQNKLKEKTKNELTLENLNETLAKMSFLDKKIGLCLLENFGHGDSLQKEWPHTISDNDVDDFLNHLVFAVNQPNEDELGNIIKQQIGKEYGFISTKYIYYEIFERVLKLMQGKEGSRFITSKEVIEFLKTRKNEIFLSPSLMYECELHSTPYVFERRDEMENFISSGKTLWFMNSDTPWLNSLVIYQSLKNIKHCFKFLFIPLNFFQANYETINKFKLDLLIICETSEENDNSSILKAPGVIKDIIEDANDVSKKIIFITFENKEFFEQTELKKFPYFDESLTIYFSDLIAEFQRKLFEEEIIFFQRSKTKQSLKQILCLGEEDMNQQQTEKFDLDSRSLEVLLKYSCITLWEKRPWFSDLEWAHYKPNIELDSDQVQQTIRSYPGDIFVFKAGKSEINELLLDQKGALHSSAEITSEFSPEVPNFIHLKGNSMVFRELCHLVDENSNNETASVSPQSLHFLKQTGSNTWKWKDTYDKGIYMQRKLCTLLKKEHSLSEADLTKCAYRLVLLAGNHGSGKSFTLTRIAELIKKEKPYSLVIKIDLKLHKRKFASKSWKTTEELMEVILLCGGIPEQNPLTQKILAYKLQIPGHVYILWDHLDELEPGIRGNVLDLFERLRKYTESIMWVATRRNGKQLLENELSYVVYVFETWKEENQAEFLAKYWENSLKFTHNNTQQLVSNLLRKLAKDVIEDFQRCLPEEGGIKTILSIPLYLRFVAETYLKQKIYIAPQNICVQLLPLFIEKLLTGDIYHSIVDTNSNLYLDEKAEELDEESRSSLKQSYTKAYGKLAVQHICGDSQKYVNISPKKQNTFSLDILSRIGLIEKKEETSIFVHRSLAEYFTVEQISRKLVRTPVSNPVWDLLLNEIMMHSHCRRFFEDKLISNSDLANFASRADQKQIVYGIISNQIDCSRSVLWHAAVDNLERTLIFLAKCAADFDSLKRISVPILKKCICPIEGCKKLIETFFEYGNELDANRINEFIINETHNLLITAIFKKDTENVNLLIKHVNDSDQIFRIIQWCFPSGKTALHLAARLSCFSIIEKCIEKLNRNQRQIVFNTPDVFNWLPSDYISGFSSTEKFSSSFGEYVWDLKQKRNYTSEEKVNYRRFSDSFAGRINDIFSHSKLRRITIGLYFPAFEARKTAVHGAVIARAFSQFLFMFGIEETFSVMENIREVYMKRNLALTNPTAMFSTTLSAPEVICSLIYLFMKFAEDIDFEDKSLPSELVIHEGFETISSLRSYVKRIQSEFDFAIHLIINAHVLVIYRIKGSYAYFDRNTVFVSGLQTIDELISVLEEATEFSAYQINEKSLFTEHFDVEKANAIYLDGHKKAKMIAF